MRSLTDFIALILTAIGVLIVLSLDISAGLLFVGRRSGNLELCIDENLSILFGARQV